jgi:hypothetical protein
MDSGLVVVALLGGIALATNSTISWLKTLTNRDWNGFWTHTVVTVVGNGDPGDRAVARVGRHVVACSSRLDPDRVREVRVQVHAGGRRDTVGGGGQLASPGDSPGGVDDRTPARYDPEVDRKSSHSAGRQPPGSGRRETWR